MNQTIYFRKENWEKFKDEPQKSELVNLLLARHYDIYKQGTLIEDVKYVNSVGSPELEKILDPDTGRCEHGFGPRLCLNKKCKNYQFKR